MSGARPSSMNAELARREAVEAELNAPKVASPSVPQFEPLPNVESYYLVPQLDTEPPAADAWQRLYAPNVRQEDIVIELALTALRPSNAVYVLCRKPVRGRHGGQIRPAEPKADVVNGHVLHAKVDSETLAEDFQAYGPILVKDHWEEGQTRFSSKLNRQSFMNALGALATPWAPVFVDGNSCKPPILPSILCLRYA